MKYRELLKNAVEKLENADIYPSAAQLLMVEYCKEENIDLYAGYEDEAEEDFIARFNRGVERLSAGEPLGYILGFEVFHGYEFAVDPRVFIPRPETEELVVETLALIEDNYFGKEAVSGLDLGTGSGAIAVTLKLELPQLDIWASDISEEALGVARDNAEKHGAQINFVRGDLFAAIPEGQLFDFVVCNPPYIKTAEELDKSVRDYEPEAALFGGNDGLAFYKRIFAAAPKYLKPKNFLSLEIGYDQAAELQKLAQESFPAARIEILRDINSKDRMLFIINEKR